MYNTACTMTNSYRPLSALNSRMPSAGPQIWMTSSRVSFSRSAPEEQESHHTRTRTFSDHTKGNMEYSTFFWAHYDNRMRLKSMCLLNEYDVALYGSWVSKAWCESCMECDAHLCKPDRPFTREVCEETAEWWKTVSMEPLLCFLWRCRGQQILFVQGQRERTE